MATLNHDRDGPASIYLTPGLRASYRLGAKISVHFRGEDYNDDRMFVLYVCKCVIVARDDTTITTTVCHDSAPDEHTWCLVTYRNTSRYPITRVDHFDSQELAHAYRERIEPTTPLVSLGGMPPAAPLSYAKYVDWKRSMHFREYDFRSMYTPGGHHHRETIISARKP